MRIPVSVPAASLATLLAVAGCVPAPPQAPPPVRAPVQAAPVPPPTPVAADWRDWPLTPGGWTYARQDLGSSATFGGSGGRLLVISCDNDRRVRIARPGTPAGLMTIRTSSTTRTLSTQLIGDPPSGAAVALTPTDSLLDAIGFSRGRFIVEQAGTPPLVIPAWAEIERVTEDCRG